jgi:hypothetical protein
MRHLNEASAVELLRIGVTGHRELKQPVQPLAETLRRLLRGLTTRLGKQVIGISALAEGADTLFAEQILALGWCLEVLVPFSSYKNNLDAEASRNYERLLARASSVFKLPWANRTTGAYLSGGLWIVDHSDVMVSVWDGQPARGLAGTAEIVAYARYVHKPQIIVNPHELTVVEELEGLYGSTQV